MKNLIFILTVFILCISCSGNNTGDVIVIPVAKTINDVRDRAAGSDIIKSYRIIPLETSDSILIGIGQICRVTDRHIYILDNSTVHIFDHANGNLISKFNRRGNGPGEYLAAMDVSLDPEESKMYIHDFMKKNINVYDLQGKSLAQFPNDSITFFTVDREGRFIASYPPFGKWRHIVGVYDSDWKPLASFIDNPPLGNRKIEIWPNYPVSLFNGEPHIYLSDTLFLISSEKVTPFLTLDKASRRAPEEVSLTAPRGNERDKYIMGDYGYLVGNYYILHFWYQGAAYYDIWNISNEELLYRTIRTGPEMPEGIPFDLDGKIVYVWPKYVQDNSIFCLLALDQASAVYPQYNENDNPILLEIEL